MTQEKQGYTICDRATYLSRINQLRLQVVVEGDPELINYYSAMQVNPQRFPSARSDLARQLIDWLCSPEGQNLIGRYTVNGRALFKPAYAGGK
jgi:tungstate transport system substrate-binding protein